ncbi:hypothetical protein [Bacteroides faecium]|uniref:Uncharacterized protein n=1 Tax=Bacteroides faecium TaxID=2715212 RepID=A0A6H0KTQ3_9BACE|nr:hypothetical protein [Bacteroides faecium]QIU96533.1 hypothetical protein BacF7301_21310 [Bacteroides faecium]
MEIVFNEQSIYPLAEDMPEVINRIRALVKTYKEAEKHNFKRIRYLNSFDEILLTKDISLTDFCNSKQPYLRTLGGILLGLACHPFIDDNSEEEERYIKNKFYLTIDSKKTMVYGLAAAYLYNTIGINLNSSDYWNKLLYNLQIEGEEQQEMDILSVCSEQDFSCEEFINWSENIKEVELVECKILASDKKIHLRADHGSDTLVHFSKKICQSLYVKEVINSLPYNSHAVDFIHKVTATGLIEIVLTNTDKGLGIVIQTTGRTLKETEKIACLLQEKYRS